MAATTYEVHGVPLLHDRVDIVYGLPYFPPGYGDAKRQFFPHSRQEAFGGCIMGKPLQCAVEFCPQCRVAEDAWLAAADVPFEDTF